MISDEVFELSNGVTVPKIALGTWQVSETEAVKAVSSALSVGYRHIDSAVAYENEAGVAAAIEKSGIPRKEIFVTSKVPAEIKSYKGAWEAIEASVQKLGKPVDLMLIHAPLPWSEMWSGKYRYFEENKAVWRALEESCEQGYCRAVGVSNFNEEDLESLLPSVRIKPMVNQICVHIGNVPRDIIEYCQKRDILVEAYSPNATGRLLNDPDLTVMARQYGVSVPRLAIRFCLQLGLLPLPKTTHIEYMKQNLQLDFEISKEDMQVLLSK